MRSKKRTARAAASVAGGSPPSWHPPAAATALPLSLLSHATASASPASWLHVSAISAQAVPPEHLSTLVLRWPAPGGASTPAQPAYLALRIVTSWHEMHASYASAAAEQQLQVCHTAGTHDSQLAHEGKRAGAATHPIRIARFTWEERGTSGAPDVWRKGGMVHLQPCMNMLAYQRGAGGCADGVRTYVGAQGALGY